MKAEWFRVRRKAVDGECGVWKPVLVVNGRVAATLAWRVDVGEDWKNVSKEMEALYEIQPMPEVGK